MLQLTEKEERGVVRFMLAIVGVATLTTLTVIAFAIARLI